MPAKILRWRRGLKVSHEKILLKLSTLRETPRSKTPWQKWHFMPLLTKHEWQCIKQTYLWICDSGYSVKYLLPLLCWMD